MAKRVIKTGSTVKVLPHPLNDHNGLYNDEMEEFIGQIGEFICIDQSDHCKVKFESGEYRFYYMSDLIKIGE